MEYYPWYKKIGKREIQRLEFRDDPGLPWEMHYFAAPPHDTSLKEHGREKNPVVSHMRERHPSYPM